MKRRCKIGRFHLVPEIIGDESDAYTLVLVHMLDDDILWQLVLMHDYHERLSSRTSGPGRYERADPCSLGL